MTGLRMRVGEIILAAETAADAFHRAGDDEMGVGDTLGTAAVHLAHAAWNSRWRPGRVANRIGDYYARNLVRNQARVSCCHEPGLGDVVNLALKRTATIREALDQAPVVASVRHDVTHAWLCLGQVRYAVDLNGALPMNYVRINVPAGADCSGAAIGMRSILGELRPLAVALSRFSYHPRVAVPAGLAAMAYQHLARCLSDLVSADQSPVALDVAGEPLGVPHMRNFGDAKHQAGRICDRLHQLGKTVRDLADRIDNPDDRMSWNAATYDRLSLVDMCLGGAADRLQKYADAL